MLTCFCRRKLRTRRLAEKVIFSNKNILRLVILKREEKTYILIIIGEKGSAKIESKQFMYIKKFSFANLTSYTRMSSYSSHNIFYCCTHMPPSFESTLIYSPVSFDLFARMFLVGTLYFWCHRTFIWKLQFLFLFIFNKCYLIFIYLVFRHSFNSLN